MLLHALVRSSTPLRYLSAPQASVATRTIRLHSKPRCAPNTITTRLRHKKTAEEEYIKMDAREVGLHLSLFFFPTTPCSLTISARAPTSRYVHRLHQGNATRSLDLRTYTHQHWKMLYRFHPRTLQDLWWDSGERCRQFATGPVANNYQGDSEGRYYFCIQRWQRLIFFSLNWKFDFFSI